MFKFFQDLYSEYLKIKTPLKYEELTKLGKHIAWYQADSSQSLVSIYSSNNINIVELDIKGAFPTICTALFGSNHQFIQNMNMIQEKKEKNIFISTSLTAIDNNLLPLLNNICKLIILGIVFDTNDEDEINSINILELKKDGCIFSCNDLTYYRLLEIQKHDSSFNKLLQDNNFIFHIDKYNKYIRAHQTSFYEKENNEIIIKGIYKHIPKKLEELIKYLLLNKKNNINDKENIKEIYDIDFFNICLHNNLRKYLNDYYICFENKVLNYDGKYDSLSLKVIVDPSLYIKIFLSPILIANTLNI